MSTELTVFQKNQTRQWNEDQIQLLKDTVCKGATNDEFNLFTYICERAGLDPFLKQIHCVQRYDSTLNRKVMSYQISIDGFRLIADRTGKYMPGKETLFSYDTNGKMISSTAYVKKLGPDNQWHEISSTAYFEEYVNKTKEGKITSMWMKPHIMLGKCAEAAALRKAFPADLSGLYAEEELLTSGVEIDITEKEKKGRPGPTINREQAKELLTLTKKDETFSKKWLEHFGIESFMQLPAEHYEHVLNNAKTKFAPKSQIEKKPEESKKENKKEPSSILPVEGRLFPHLEAEGDMNLAENFVEAK